MCQCLFMFFLAFYFHIFTSFRFESCLTFSCFIMFFQFVHCYISPSFLNFQQFFLIFAIFFFFFIFHFFLKNVSSFSFCLCLTIHATLHLYRPKNSHSQYRSQFHSQFPEFEWVDHRAQEHKPDQVQEQMK